MSTQTTTKVSFDLGGGDTITLPPERIVKVEPLQNEKYGLKVTAIVGFEDDGTPNQNTFLTDEVTFTNYHQER